MKSISCISCNSLIPAGSKFCPECGQKVDSQCNCGYRFTGKEKFCPECGNPSGSGKSPTQGSDSGSPNRGIGGFPSLGSPLWTTPDAGGASLSTQPELPAGAELMHFRIESLLGKGASSAVYRAENILLGEAVALKVVASFDSEHPLLGAYRDEYKAQLAVRNEHILHIEAPLITRHQELTWLMLPMELARESLRDWMDRHRVGDDKRLEQGLELFRQACGGVQALHDQGLVHLDIKPENILLTGSEDSPVVKVADFGLSRSMSRQDQRGSLFGDGIGTPAYMAPEQILAARWKDVGKEADIYALGMILYELLDGDLPYSGSAEQIKAKKRDESVNVHEPGGFPQLAELALWCLHRTVKNRPESTGQILEQLDQVQRGLADYLANRQQIEVWIQEATELLKKRNLEDSLKILDKIFKLDEKHFRANQLKNRIHSEKKKRLEQVLNELGFNTIDQIKRGETPLHVAIRENKINSLSVLLNEIDEPNLISKLLFKSLSHFQKESIEVIDLMLNNGADISFKHNSSNDLSLQVPLLHESINVRTWGTDHLLEVMDLLLARGASVNYRVESINILHEVVWVIHKKSINPGDFKLNEEFLRSFLRKIINAGFKLNEENSGDIFLAGCRHFRFPMETDHKKNLWLFLNTFNEFLSFNIFKLDHSQIKEINNSYLKGKTALHYLNNDNEKFRIIASHCSNLDVKDANGWTPLFGASPKVSEYLIEKGANVNAVSEDGTNTPLYMIIEYMSECLDENSRIPSEYESCLKIFMDEGATISKHVWYLARDFERDGKKDLINLLNKYK